MWKQAVRENPRIRELLAKVEDDTIIDPERAELAGVFEFTENPRAAELLAKRILCKITPEEAKELNGYEKRKVL